MVAEGSTEVVTTVVTGSGIFGKPQNPGQRYYPDPEDSYETPKPTTTGGATTTNPNPTPPVPLPLPDGPLDTSKEIEIDESINLLEDTSDESKEPGKEIKQFINSHKFVTGDVKRPPIFGKRPLGEVQLSEEAPVMKIFATGSGTFNSQMVGGEIRIPKESKWRKDLNLSCRTKSDINIDALPTKEGYHLGVVLFFLKMVQLIFLQFFYQFFY